MPQTSPGLDKPSFGSRLAKAFKEFMAIPVGLCALGAGLAVLMTWIEGAQPSLTEPVLSFLRRHFHSDPAKMADLLGLLTTAMFGLSTLTFSVLLIALQQSGASLGIQVVDGFIRRRRNQVVLGFILATTVYVLLSRALVMPPHNPLAASFVALLFGLLALITLAALFYMTTNQSRPTFVVNDLRLRALEARRAQYPFLDRTRREPANPDNAYVTVKADRHGYVRSIDFDALRKVAVGSPGSEIELVCEIGDYLVWGDPVAHLRGLSDAAVDPVRKALDQASQRSLAVDPTVGLSNLQTITRRTGSDAQQN